MFSIDFFLTQLHDRVGDLGITRDSQGHYQLTIDGIESEIFELNGELYIQTILTKLDEDLSVRQSKIARCLELMLLPNDVPNLVACRDSEKGTLNLYQKLDIHHLQYDVFESALENIINCTEHFQKNISVQSDNIVAENFMYIVKP